MVGGRSIVAASVFKRAGVKNVANLDGGIEAWKLDMLPIESSKQDAVAIG